MAEQASTGYAKGRARRAQILRAAETTFAERGYRGTSLATIARAVGITEAGLLHHFPTKQDLLIGVLESRDDAGIAEAREGPQDRPAGEALVAEFTRSLAEPQLARLYLVLAAESIETAAPGHEHFVRRYRRVRSLVAASIDTHRTTGALPPGPDADTVATQVLALWDGLLLQRLLDPGSADVERAFADAVHQLLAVGESPGPDADETERSPVSRAAADTTERSAVSRADVPA